MKKAVIGIGSNSVRMLAVSMENDGAYQLKRDREGTRLFAGLDEHGNLSAESMNKTIAAVTRMAADARALLTSCGSRAWTEDLARWHLDQANSAAERHQLPAALVREIRSATDDVLGAAEHALRPAAGAATVETRTGQLA